MNPERLETSLEAIRQLLSHLHGEITTLEDSYQQVLRVLKRFEHVANIDELSGLMRREAFFQKWNELLEECRKVERATGVLLIDIDHFKRVNDQHGHATGDEVIRRVSELLRRYESPDCITGRYGGEEFAVAIRGSDAEILGTAELIRRGVEKLHGPVVGPDGELDNSVEWRVTLSLGMASTTRHKYNAQELISAADDALYKAKRKGRNQVRAA